MNGSQIKRNSTIERKTPNKVDQSVQPLNSYYNHIQPNNESKVTEPFPTGQTFKVDEE